MDAAHEATYDFDFDSPADARVVERSVRRELSEIDDDRSRATLDREGATVSVRVEATDLTALRAATNTWLSLVGTAEDAAAVARDQSA